MQLFVLFVQKKQRVYKLIKLLKLLNVCESGADAKLAVTNKMVCVNGIIELRKRKKLIKGNKIEFRNTIITIV